MRACTRLRVRLSSIVFVTPQCRHERVSDSFVVKGADGAWGLDFFVPNRLDACVEISNIRPGTAADRACVLAGPRAIQQGDFIEKVNGVSGCAWDILMTFLYTDVRAVTTSMFPCWTIIGHSSLITRKPFRGTYVAVSIWFLKAFQQ